MLGKNYVTNEPRRNDSPVEAGKSPSGEENGEQAFTIYCVGDASCVHRLRRDIQAGTKNVDESNLRLDYSLPAFGKSSNKRFEYIW